MAHIHQAAASRGITQLFADVSLTAEPFFRKSGFVVESRQLVEVRGVVLANARMCKVRRFKTPICRSSRFAIQQRFRWCRRR